MGKPTLARCRSFLSFFLSFCFLSFTLWGGGYLTVKYVPDCRDNGDERAPSNLHTAALAKGHVEAVCPALDFDERPLFLGR